MHSLDVSPGKQAAAQGDDEASHIHNSEQDEIRAVVVEAPVAVVVHMDATKFRRVVVVVVLGDDRACPQAKRSNIGSHMI